MTQPALRTQTSELHTDAGIEQTARRQAAQALEHSVAGTYRPFIMTQGLHWNVQRPLFYRVHKLAEEHYRDMFEAIDDLAERIRAPGSPAPQSISSLITSVALREPEVGGELQGQIETLIAGSEKVASDMRAAVGAAEARNDVRTADLLTERVGVHEENAWKLRAMIAD